MRLKVFLICFIFIESATAKRLHRDHDLLNPMLMEIIEMFRSLREHSNWLVSDELFLYDYKETLPIFSQKSFNISVSNVSMRDYRKKSSITYEDLVVTCLYGKYFNLALPSKTENAIEFFGNIEASYPFSQSNGTFAVTYDGVKFHLKADREDHIIKVMRYENTNENLDIPLHIQIRNAEFKTEIFEPLIYEKFDHWIDGNEPLRFMMSRCFNYPNSHSSVHYETKYADYIISVSGLSDFQKVILVNDATTMKVELHASPLKGTVKFTNSSNTQASDFKIQSSGLRVFGDFYISNEGDHSRARRAKMRITLNDFNITNTSNSTMEQLVTLGRHTIGAVRDHIQNSIKESLLEEWLND